MTIKNNPVVFIHGLWLHASSWSPWVDLFEHAGYTATAPGWPGVRDTVAEARENPEDIADKGIDDVVEHYARIIKTLPSAPILVGHSFGGMIAEKLLGMDLAAAAVAIDAAQIKGVLPLPLSALHSTLPVFKNPANKHRAVTLTREQFRYSFGNAVEENESDDLYARWAIPAPGKPLFEAAAANFSLHSPAAVNTKNSDRGPLLLIMGGKDHTVPEAITKSTLK
jgi:pimeloyl-ACP methyl ester carboxylesterase